MADDQDKFHSLLEGLMNPDNNVRTAFEVGINPQILPYYQEGMLMWHREDQWTFWLSPYRCVTLLDSHMCISAHVEAGVKVKTRVKQNTLGRH